MIVKSLELNCSKEADPLVESLKLQVIYPSPSPAVVDEENVKLLIAKE